MAEVDDFLAIGLPRFREAEIAFHNGDVEPRKAMWTRNDPVTLFGAVLTGAGSADIERSFDALAARFSNCTAYDVEVIAAGASGDLGYLVAIEHTTASVAGGEPQPYELRVTTVFRREDGEWKIVHRHGDPVPESETARSQARRMSDDLKS